jgi:hypothetical protein
MKQLPWTKFQDFYLRLGFLKLLVAAISPDRRSASNDTIVQRLVRPLFESTRKPDRIRGLRATVRVPPHERESNLVETLLIDGACPSLLYAVTGPTAYKILDWGRDVDLIGRGNQITERGLLLRHLLDESRAQDFLSGNVSSWNPFPLPLEEKLFFLYHLAEIDGVIFELLNDLGALREGTVLESNAAARMTCTALLRVLSRAMHDVQPRDVLKFRVACTLAYTIADELGMSDEARALMGPLPRKGPRPMKIGAQRGRSLGRLPRKTTKNADHQTIPRFEQLVDLGFLEKPGHDAPDEAERRTARQRWRYRPTEVCRRWHRAMQGIGEDNRIPFRWRGFASACFEAFEIPLRGDASGDERAIAEYVWRAYTRIHRRAGVNPLDSVALFAMLSAAVDGVRLEMAEVHELMLRIKHNDALPEHVSFASGNDLDQMFIHIKPGFLEQFELRN